MTTNDFLKIREEFPILKEKIYEKSLIYFDNAATTQKPKVVINKLYNIYATANSNIHRGSYYLSDKTTAEYENTRKQVKTFINANANNEIIFTKGATEAINLVANCFGEKFLDENDEVIITEMEHHSNIVPWQLICEKKKAKIKAIPITQNGTLDLEKLDHIITKNTRIIAIKHVCNATGIINPIKKIIQKAKKYGIITLIDGTQAIPHSNIDVQELDCDFYIFSGHKLYAPNGTGVLYGKEKWLTEFPPYQGGGEMIEKVTIEKTTYSHLPLKFEAGTPNYPSIIAMGTAINFIQDIGIKNIQKYEEELLNYATNKLSNIPSIHIVGPALIKDKGFNKISIISFLSDKAHPYDILTIMDKEGIAARTGHHCCQPLMRSLGIEGTFRISLAFYNTKNEIDIFSDKLIKILNLF